MAKISIREAYNFNFSVNEQEKKELLVLKWLVAFREYLLKNKIANYGDIMPNKKDISKYLKVSTGQFKMPLNMRKTKVLIPPTLLSRTKQSILMRTYYSQKN